MRTNPNNPIHLRRLRSAMEQSLRKLGGFNEKTKHAVEQYVGFHYSDNGTRKKHPINMLEIAATIYVRMLAPKNPSVMARPKAPALKAFAKTWELAINHLLGQIGFDDTLARVVLNSLFGLGIGKVGMCEQASVEVKGFRHDVGQPFFEDVSQDNWVHDMSASVYEKIQFAGDRYRIDYEHVMESDLYNSAKEQLKPTPKGYTSDTGAQKLDAISQGRSAMDEQYRDQVELWDVWLPMENLVVTVAAEGDLPPLRIVEWAGPECGPYHLLSFTHVPGNLMPLPPVAGWLDLNEMLNVVVRKVKEQAEAMKTILGYAAGSEDDAQQIIQATHLKAVRMNNPDRVKEFNFNGIDPASLALLVQLREAASWVCGNVDLMNGLSSQGDTLGQAKLMAESSSQRVTDMQERVTKYAQRVIRDLGWYLWTDPLIDLPLIKRPAGTQDVEVPVRFNPELREGDFIDYNLELVPYSMQPQTPGLRLASFKGFLQDMGPFLPYFQQAGATLNPEGIARLYARLIGLHELEDVFMFINPQEMPQEPIGELPSKAPVTTRNYVHQSQPTQSDNGLTKVLASLAMGKQSQPNEAAGVLG